MLAKFTFFALFSVIVVNSFTAKFSIATKLLEQPKKEYVIIEVEVKNISNEAIKLFKHRRQDYKYEKVKSLGNHVIKVERFENGEYRLFTPSADINPIFENQEYITLNKNESITDTLEIEGYSFSRKESSGRGFPSGKYRLKVYFNSDLRTQSEENSSSWIEFQIN
jgi:hypothetical protein